MHGKSVGVPCRKTCDLNRRRLSRGESPRNIEYPSVKDCTVLLNTFFKIQNCRIFKLFENENC